MRRMLMVTGLVAAVAVPSLASARDYCGQQAHDRRMTGTLLGAVGGALVGHAISHKNGALIGGLGGAVIGNQVARTSCDRYTYRSSRYYRSSYPRHARYRPTPAYAPAYGAAYPGYATPGGYRDTGYGFRPAYAAAYPGYATVGDYRDTAYGVRPAYGYGARPYTAACRYETRPFYDERGQVVYAPTSVCGE